MTKNKLALESLDQGQAGLPVLGAVSGRAEADSSHFPHQPGEAQAGPSQSQLWTDHSFPLLSSYTTSLGVTSRGTCAGTLMPLA